jgi:hypothetical protein
MTRSNLRRHGLDTLALTREQQPSQVRFQWRAPIRVTHSVTQTLEVVIKPGAINGELVHRRTIAPGTQLVTVYDTVVLEAGSNGK